ncbi:MAG: beta-N-acetylhexosaminidase [Phascolarctobacterium sp.]|nr:beta-N-acetylhexosaminidase [Phascolarctobacterium sp.]
MNFLKKSFLALLCMLNTTAWANDNVQHQLQQMSLEEKVGQLFFVRPEALIGDSSAATLLAHNTGTTKVTHSMRKGIKRYPVGGVVLFGKNIKHPAQTRTLIKELRAASRNSRLIIAVDEEGGTVARLANNPEMQVINVGNMCQVNSSTKAYLAGHRIGKYLRDYDFDMDFAPVADVLVNPENKLVNKRSFGNDAKTCGIYAQEYIKGLHDYSIMSTVKHFPGHGGWEADSHIGLSESLATLEDLRAQEFVSFKKALAGDTEAVMIAHMVFPKITQDNVPASLNRYFITDILREEIGFKGLIITDSLGMEAIVKYFGPAEAAVMALNAGADILLMPNDLALAYKGILEAVQQGRVSQERLDDAVGKLLLYKNKLK